MGYGGVVIADAPVAYWRMGEGSGIVAYDARANNLNLTHIGGISLRQESAVADDAGSVGYPGLLSAYSKRPSFDALLNPNAPCSIECWARVTGGAGTWRTPMAARRDDGTFLRGIFFYAAITNRWELWWGRSDVRGWSSMAGPSVILNQWTHLVGTHDGTTGRFYVDGISVGTPVNTPFLPNDGMIFTVGIQDGGAFAPFFGQLDEVAVYSTALSAARVLVHYNERNVAPLFDVSATLSDLSISKAVLSDAGD